MKPNYSKVKFADVKFGNERGVRVDYLMEFKLRSDARAVELFSANAGRSFKIEVDY
eukprot:CAMPEP_0170485492 /NCGR_PEP_ID=MMETSP0208-20121228/4761_1 /TAXON_ID=197538 /ORGANISM="Strombidium inclinatum, Strain S3" /LENGTH=55 /DNA_ID=CAMNT_0010759175 /DNA_START=40 /DNA_END=207 /DNA_ORIENTATION=-